MKLQRLSHLLEEPFMSPEGDSKDLKYVLLRDLEQQPSSTHVGAVRYAKMGTQAASWRLKEGL